MMSRILRATIRFPNESKRLVYKDTEGGQAIIGVGVGGEVGVGVGAGVDGWLMKVLRLRMVYGCGGILKWRVMVVVVVGGLVVVAVVLVVTSGHPSR